MFQYTGSGSIKNNILIEITRLRGSINYRVLITWYFRSRAPASPRAPFEMGEIRTDTSTSSSPFSSWGTPGNRISPGGGQRNWSRDVSWTRTCMSGMSVQQLALMCHLCQFHLCKTISFLELALRRIKSWKKKHSSYWWLRLHLRISLIILRWYTFQDQGDHYGAFKVWAPAIGVSDQTMEQAGWRSGHKMREGSHHLWNGSMWNHECRFFQMLEEKVIL